MKQDKIIELLKGNLENMGMDENESFPLANELCNLILTGPSTDYEDFIGEDLDQFETSVELKSDINDNQWNQFVKELEELCHIHGVRSRWTL